MNRRQFEKQEDVSCKFDEIITDDYMTSFYDKNIILKLYNSLEYFIKSIFYDRYELILQNIPYNSKEFKVIFGCERIRKDFNLHYKHSHSSPSAQI